MRAYPIDSPPAAARIVAMAILADGNECSTEGEMLDRMDMKTALGLRHGEWESVLRDYCEDLIVTGHETGSLRPDGSMIAAFFGEVQDPELRLKILETCSVVAGADSHLADGESIILQAAAAHWSMASSAPRLPAAHALA